MKNKDSNLSKQNILILSGLVISTLLIVFLAIFAMSNIQHKLELSYSRFGQMLTKTLAMENAQHLGAYFGAEGIANLKEHTHEIVSDNDDIAFVEFYDNNNNIIYSSKLGKEATEKSFINISSPMIDDGKQIGSVTVGLSGNSIKGILKTTKNSILFIFTIVWLVFTLVVIINTFLITRELRMLQFGVSKISTGQFGYQLDGKSTSGEVKELIKAFNDMSARLHIYEEQNIDELTLEKNKFEAVLMSIANGVVVCDRRDNVVLVNNIAQKMLEADPKYFLSTKIQQYCDSNGGFCFKDKIELFKNTPLDIMETKPLEFNIEVDHKILKSVISPMFSKNQDYMGYIIVLIDVTKEVEVDKLKSNFISNVSHELRTPVTILRSYIDTLFHHGDEFDTATKAEFLEILNNEADRLHRMVNDILDFSRFESTTIELEKAECDIVSLIEKIIHSMSLIAKEKNISFALMKEEGLPQVPLNSDSIERVVQNLVSNAIKYSPDGGKIQISAHLAEDNDCVEVTIKDHGIGIAPEYQEKIFDRFFRVENKAHTIKGTGLGLHLVKVAVEKHHGGKIFVISMPNEGSTFGFRLPLQPERASISTNDSGSQEFENV